MSDVVQNKVIVRHCIYKSVFMVKNLLFWYKYTIVWFIFVNQF